MSMLLGTHATRAAPGLSSPQTRQPSLRNDSRGRALVGSPGQRDRRLWQRARCGQPPGHRDAGSAGSGNRRGSGPAGEVWPINAAGWSYDVRSRHATTCSRNRPGRFGARARAPAASMSATATSSRLTLSDRLIMRTLPASSFATVAAARLAVSSPRLSGSTARSPSSASRRNARISSVDSDHLDVRVIRRNPGAASPDLSDPGIDPT